MVWACAHFVRSSWKGSENLSLCCGILQNSDESGEWTWCNIDILWWFLINWTWMYDAQVILGNLDDFMVNYKNTKYLFIELYTSHFRNLTCLVIADSSILNYQTFWSLNFPKMEGKNVGRFPLSSQKPSIWSSAHFNYSPWNQHRTC